jgi:hypothetical protein
MGYRFVCKRRRHDWYASILLILSGTIIGLIIFVQAWNYLTADGEKMGNIRQVL